MAEAEMLRIAARRGAGRSVGITVIHRHGRIAAGDDIVLVATASAHREAAFAAANFLMDYLKTSAPFWKKEHAASGESGGWVAASRGRRRGRRALALVEQAPDRAGNASGRRRHRRRLP
jgi:molybdopterin synthase catalytic subunit